MILRLATRADEPGIQHVIRTVFEEYGWPWEEDGYHGDLYDIESAYFADGGSFWVIEDDSQVVGTAALDLFDTLPTDGEVVVLDGLPRVSGADCSVERMYLLPEYRGKGFGKQLLTTVVERAKELERKRLEIWSDKLLTDAHRLYSKFGATQVGDRICPSPDQSPEWGFRIDL